MMRVGLTGGIAAGKSVVAERLRVLGAVVIDADALARAVVQPGTPGLAEVVETFGPELLGPAGSLDRTALGTLVFGDEDARRRLEAIVHPLVRAAAQEREDAAVAADPEAVIVHDIPLLVETGQGGAGSRFDVVVVVDAPVETQVERLVTTRGMTPEQARGRVEAQASRADRRAVADVVLDNAGSRDELIESVDRLWSTRLRPGG